MRPLLLLLAAVLVAGCTAEVPGRPTAATDAPLPSRPREVRLDGVDPCSLLTPQQRAELGFTSEPSASRPYVALFRGEVPTCTIGSRLPDPRILGIGTVTSVGLERWRQGDLAADVRSTSVDGFPAVIARPTQSRVYCAVEIDVASGQMVDIQLIDGGRNPSLPQDELCTGAERAALEIVKSLIAR